MPPGGYNLSITDGTGRRSLTDLARVLATDAARGAALFGTGIGCKTPARRRQPGLQQRRRASTATTPPAAATCHHHLRSGRPDQRPAAPDDHQHGHGVQLRVAGRRPGLHGGNAAVLPRCGPDRRRPGHDPRRGDDKQLIGTSVVTGNNAVNQAVIGETIKYDVVITLPEGTTNVSTVVDTLDLGLEFVSLAA